MNTGDLSTVAADAEGTHGPACLKANVIMLLASARVQKMMISGCE